MGQRIGLLLDGCSAGSGAEPRAASHSGKDEKRPHPPSGHLLPHAGEGKSGERAQRRLQAGHGFLDVCLAAGEGESDGAGRTEGRCATEQTRQAAETGGPEQRPARDGVSGTKIRRMKSRSHDGSVARTTDTAIKRWRSGSGCMTTDGMTAT